MPRSISTYNFEYELSVRQLIFQNRIFTRKLGIYYKYDNGQKDYRAHRATGGPTNSYHSRYYVFKLFVFIIKFEYSRLWDVAHCPVRNYRTFKWNASSTPASSCAMHI